MLKIKFIPFFLAIGLCFAAAAIGSVFTAPAIPTWYASLNKPFFNPPSWIFGPVWTTLYLMMGISLYIVGQKKGKNNIHRKGQTYFFIQLILNAVWSIVFFGLQSPLLAFFIILALWISILLTIKYFYHISKPAGLLLIPYLAWVSFASVLNFFILILNP